MSTVTNLDQSCTPSLEHFKRSNAATSTPTVLSLHEDIVTLVFAEFNTSLSAERAACARGALVCRMWAESALKVLWRSLRSLLPLYGVLLPVPQVVRKTYIGNFFGSHVPLAYIEYIGEVSADHC